VRTLFFLLSRMTYIYHSSLSIRQDINSCLNQSNCICKMTSATNIYFTGVSMILPTLEDGSLLNIAKCVFDGTSLLQSSVKEEKQQSHFQFPTASPTSLHEDEYHSKRAHTSAVTTRIQQAGVDALLQKYPLPANMKKSLDVSGQIAVIAGLQALVDASAVSTNINATEATPSSNETELQSDLQASTGVIFASSFHTLDTMLQSSPPTAYSADSSNRSWLFRVLVTANSQLAQLIKARGPNMHLSATCASTSYAIATAEDWLRGGRCDRVVIIAADNVTSDAALPVIKEAFRSCGVTSSETSASQAAQPFSPRRSGMLLGAGALGIVMETNKSCEQRRIHKRACLIGTHLCNSALHACRMDPAHLGEELSNFVKQMMLKLNISTLTEFCENTIYMAHETGTKGQHGCSVVEMKMLESVFKQEGKTALLIAGTKWMTAHAMAASFESVISILSLDSGLVPPICTHKNDIEPEFGDICLSRGGAHDRKFILHFSAGFGSHATFVLYSAVHAKNHDQLIGDLATTANASKVAT
jgi:3-oxoacyl-(acyl-carrier-protein) synthase